MEINQQFLDAIKSSCGAPLNLFDSSAIDRLEKVQLFLSLSWLIQSCRTASNRSDWPSLLVMNTSFDSL